MYLTLGVLVGGIADRLASGALPYRWPAAASAGVIGAVLASLPLQDQGPKFLAVALVPATVGASLGAAALQLALARMANLRGQ